MIGFNAGLIQAGLYEKNVSYLFQFPVELGRSEGIHLGEVSPQ